MLNRMDKGGDDNEPPCRQHHYTQTKPIGGINGVHHDLHQLILTPNMLRKMPKDNNGHLCAPGLEQDVVVAIQGWCCGWSLAVFEC